MSLPGSALLAVLVAVLVAATVVGGRLASASAQEDLVRRGGVVFQTNCAACHGTEARGRAGTGSDAGPSLRDLPLPYVDLAVRTGRMPIAAPELGVLADRLDDEERVALVTWMAAELGLGGSIPEPGRGDAARGLEPFVRHCASCHGAGGVGGVAGGGTRVPAIAGADAVTIVEALRVGPGEMPAFSDALVDDETAADIAAYLDAADEAPRTALGLQEVDPVAAALAAVAVVVAALGVVRAVGHRGTRGQV